MDVWFLHEGLTFACDVCYCNSGAAGGKKISGIASARMRLDGFVQLEPKEPETPAILITKPIIFDGNVLCINADAGGAGKIVVVLVARFLLFIKFFFFF